MTTVHPSTPPFLKPEQLEHYYRLREIVSSTKVYLDTSPTGTGKTYITLGLAYEFNCPLVIVCPVSVTAKWQKLAQQLGITVLCIMSYTKLGGIQSGRNGQPQVKHPYLTRSLNPGQPFQVTAEWLELVRQGVILIFDESQNLKNDKTVRMGAAHALVTTITANTNPSRVGLLSATPLDKDIHALTYFKMSGLMIQPEAYIYDKSDERYYPTGLQEIYDYCRQWNPELVEHCESLGVTRHNVASICKRLWIEVIVKHQASSMVAPAKKVNCDCKNGFYQMGTKDLLLLKEGVDKLGRSCHYDEKSVNIGDTISWGSVNKALMAIEQAKYNTFIRLAKQKLDQEPNCKVLLYFNYLGNMDLAEVELRPYGVARLDGDVPVKKRDTLLTRFQAPNLECRVFLSTPRCGGVGIDLDDQHGGFPRYMFISPSYYFMNIHQTAGRVFRNETKSDAVVRLVYGSVRNEIKIIEALVRKSNTTKSSLAGGEEANKKVIFPSDYQEEEEAIGITIPKDGFPGECCLSLD